MAEAFRAGGGESIVAPGWAAGGGLGADGEEALAGHAGECGVDGALGQLEAIETVELFEDAVAVALAAGEDRQHGQLDDALAHLGFPGTHELGEAPVCCDVASYYARQSSGLGGGVKGADSLGWPGSDVRPVGMCVARAVGPPTAGYGLVCDVLEDGYRGVRWVSSRVSERTWVGRVAMPIFRLGRRPEFPPAELAEPEGVLAVGGKLNREWLVAAYSRGMFPWYDRPPILWWCPDPRLVLIPGDVHVSRRLARTMRQGRFEVRVDTAFRAVMRACASIPRRHESGTWINADILRAYGDLHDAGYAHSVETWAEGELVGGIYGVQIGGAFFGESMFAGRRDASKVALVGLARECVARGIELIDCQVTSEHMVRMGAFEMRRAEFLERLGGLVGKRVGQAVWVGRAAE